MTICSCPPSSGLPFGVGGFRSGIGSGLGAGDANVEEIAERKTP